MCECTTATTSFRLTVVFQVNLDKPVLLRYGFSSSSCSGREGVGFTTCGTLWQVFSEKMGLEAGWNCHICLRTEHSSDALAMLPAGDASHGYASMLAESLPDVRSTLPRNGAEGGRRRASPGRSPLRRVRCSSAPDVVPIHSANEPQRKSVTSDGRHPAADGLPAATFSWEAVEEDIADQQMSLLHQMRAARHRSVSVSRSLSASTHEPRRRSSSASVGATDRPSSRPRVLHTDHQQPGAPAEAERTHALLEEGVTEKLNGAEEDDDDDDDASYVLSSVSPGNRVRASFSR